MLRTVLRKYPPLVFFVRTPLSFSVRSPDKRCKITGYFLLTIFVYGSAKKPDEIKKEDEQTFQLITCRLVQTSYIKRILNFSCLPYNKHGRSVWEESWPRIVSTDSVLTISAKTRDLTQNTTATTTRTSRNKRFEEQNNSCARAF